MAETESEFLRRQLNAEKPESSGIPINIDGQGREEFMADARLKAQDTEEGRKILLDAEIAKRQGAASQRAALDAEIAKREAVQDPRISTDPLPTGVARIDRAGVTETPFHAPSFTRDQLSEHPDDPDRIRKDRADAGVDYNHGLPIWQRVKVATSSNIPRLRQERMQQVLSAEFANIPDDLPKFRYDPALDEFHFLREDEENPGKYRWTAMDGSGIELADLGDMLNLGEIGSMAGAVIGTGKGKAFTFGKGGSGTQAAAGGLGGGTLGRFGGEGASLLINHMQGGTPPTVDELFDLGWDAAKIEAFASVSGELGAKLLRGLRNKTKTGSFFAEVPTADEAAKLKSAADDLQEIQNVTGRDDLALTRGQATGSIELLAKEAEAIKTTSASSRSAFLAQQAKNDEALQQYVNKKYEGNAEFLGKEQGTVISANDAIGSAGQITVAQTDNGLVHFSPAVDPGHGLKVDPSGDAWQVKGALLKEEAQGTGIGTGLYESAREEAQRHGKVLVSDDTLSPDAIEVWKRLDGKEGWGKLIWNENVEEIAKGTGRMRTTDGLPLVRMAEEAPLTPMLLAEAKQVTRGADGRMVKGKEWSRFLRQPGRKELGAVVEEINANPFLKQDLKEGILRDYDSAVNAGDKFSVKAFEAWKEDTGRVLESVFTPQELLAIRKPGGIRAVVEASESATNNMRNSLARSLNIDAGHPLFKDPSVKGIWQQMKGKDGGTRRRVMRVLDLTGQGDAMRSLFKDELRLDLLNRTKGSNVGGFRKWLKANQAVIHDVLGSASSANGKELAESGATAYIKDLRVIENAMQRKSQAGMVRGAAREANPTGLALLRVAFGPLSRAQRFITGARRGTNRMTANMSAQLISDPATLRALSELRPFDIGSRRAARIIQDVGLDEMLGFAEFDAESEEDRKQLSATVMLMLQDEFDEDVEQ